MTVLIKDKCNNRVPKPKSKITKMRVQGPEFHEFHRKHIHYLGIYSDSFSYINKYCGIPCMSYNGKCYLKIEKYHWVWWTKRDTFYPYIIHINSLIKGCVHFIYMISHMKKRATNDLIFILESVCENCHFWTIEHFSWMKFHIWKYIYENVMVWMWHFSYMKLHIWNDGADVTLFIWNFVYEITNVFLFFMNEVRHKPYQINFHHFSWMKLYV